VEEERAPRHWQAGVSDAPLRWCASSTSIGWKAYPFSPLPHSASMRKVPTIATIDIRTRVATEQGPWGRRKTMLTDFGRHGRHARRDGSSPLPPSVI